LEGFLFLGSFSHISHWDNIEIFIGSVFDGEEVILCFDVEIWPHEVVHEDGLHIFIHVSLEVVGTWYRSLESY
jgi:hypothetical protein